MSIKRGEQKHDTFYVTLTKKSALPGQKPSDEVVYTITKDGKDVYQAPLITLDAETAYHFVIDTPGQPFYITTDSKGGGVILDPIQSMIGSIEIVPESTGEKGNVGIEKGTLTFTPHRLHQQMRLFYQSNFQFNAGGSIVVQLVD